MLLIDQPDAGVIDDAKRRHRRRRRAAVAALSILALLSVFLLAGGARRPGTPPLAHSSSPAPLSGAPLRGPTHVRLLIGGGIGGAVRLVDADSRSVRAVAMAGGAPLIAWLEPFGGAALASVAARGRCAGCSGPTALYEVSYDGSVRALAGAGAHAQVLAVAGASTRWTLTAAGARPCMLRRGGAAGVESPCGELISASASSVVIAQSHVELLVDAHGAILASGALLAPLSSTLVLEASAPDPVTDRSRLALVDLRTGARHRVAWPATPAGYELGQLIQSPAGGRLALELFDALTHPALAADLWVLDVRRGALTHVPGFPVLEDIKQSSVAWTADGRLLIPSQYGARNVLGIWTPGAAALRLRRLPALATYYDSVALTPR